MKTLELVFFDAGGGHRSAATALCEVARQQGRPWDMRMMNLQELLDELDVFRKITGLRMQDIYNLMLRRGWTLGSAQILPAMHTVIRVLHKSQVRLLEGYWRKSRPDMIVSVVPNFNRSLFQSAALALPGVPYVTILTDMADYPPHFWMERQQQYFICGTARAYAQAIAMGHAQERVFRTSGMVLHPRFYSTPDVDRARDREILGLDPNLPTAMMMFGGEGSPRMLDIVRRLSASDVDFQIIAVAGKNPRLEAELRKISRRIPMHVEGFTRDVPKLMRLSDFFIGKPGPGSISEAIEMGLPVIIERNIWTLPQERFNADWVTEHSAGIVLSSFRTQIVGAVATMAHSAKREAFAGSVAKLRNRAVFEIPEILESILASH